MRASDLLGVDVVDNGGQRIGVITDLRCIDDGPGAGRQHDVRVDALIVSGHHVGSMLGYGRDDQRGPWLIRVIVRRLHRNVTVVSWNRVISTDGPVIVRR